MAGPLPTDWFLPPLVAPAGVHRGGPARDNYWAGVWSRFRGNRPAVLGLLLLGLIVLGTLVGPHLTPYHYDALALLQANRPPGPEHWFGTDQLGRDTFARTWMGGRVSLLIGLAAAAIDLCIGAVYGGVAGLAGGWVDEVLMRLVDALYAIPFLLVVILLLVLLGSGLRSLIIAIALVNWLGMARLVRGQVLEIREREYVLAARVLGVPAPAILWRHLLPACLGPILVWISYNVPAAIFAEAFLSYLGLGVQPPRPSWGSMVSAASDLVRLHPWPFLFPAVAITLTLLAFYVVSDGLRDALDPRLGAGHGPAGRG